MGMYTYVIGFKPADEKFKQMKQIYDACHKVGVSVPSEVLKYFNGNIPDDSGVEVELKGKQYSNECNEGIEIDLRELDPNIKIIRFINSY